MFGSLGSASNGGAPTAKAGTVPSATGSIYTLGRLLGSTSTLSLIAGTNANLTLSGTSINATAAIVAGAAQTAVVREMFGSLAVEYPVVLTGAVVLAALGLSSLAATISVAYSVTITSSTSGSAITATSSDGTVLTVTGNTISGTFTVLGTPTITVTETLGTASNSPRVSTFTVTVAASVASSLDYSQPTNSQYFALLLAA